MKTYSELIKLQTFKERFNYLKLGGQVGEQTFGFDRYLNQNFYRLREWKQVRNQIITRDNACDLAIEDRPIPNGVKIYIHHLNPITIDDIKNKEDWLLDPEYLITVTKKTHDAIHYSDESILYEEPIVRSKGDTCPWKVY